MPDFFDSHCHLTADALRPQLDAVLARARAAGVTSFITIATDLDDAAVALEIAAGEDSVFVACGIHPHEAAKAPARWPARLRDLLRLDRVVAVGETGLDYHYDFSDRPSQERVFRGQLELACKLARPVIIHCREAHARTLGILDELAPPAGVVFHCFTGTCAEAREILDRGHWLSLTGVVTFRKSEELRHVARLLPPERIMLETDAPYLSPEPVRQVRPNEPAHLVHTAECIARERGMALADLARLSVENTRRFFRLPKA